MADYWFDRGTSGALINLLAQLPPVDTTAIESETYETSMFDLPFESYDDPLPILYQSGFLTLKSAITKGRFFCYRVQITKEPSLCYQRRAIIARP